MNFRRIDLRIAFHTLRDGAQVRRGEELVSYDFNPDGLITYRAVSRSDNPLITRDAVYTLGSDYRPREAYVRLQPDGRYEGSGWFRFTPSAIEYDTANRTAGDASGRVAIDAPVNGFGSHPVSSDLFMNVGYDHAKGGRQRPSGLYMCSPDPFGRTGPMLTPTSPIIEYVGRERLTILNRAFDADHYRLFVAGQEQAPLEEMWSIAGTHIFLQARAAGVYETRYEIERFDAVE